MQAFETESGPAEEERKAGELFAFPVSSAQWRLWFLDQLEPGSPAYNIAAAVRLSGPLDIGVLAESLREVVRRHETLRTTFAIEDGDPVQVIASESPLPLPLLDLRGGWPDREAREAEARRLAAEQAGRPFDLGRGPLLRTTLVRLDEDEHVLLLAIHHIISDGWSLGVLVREVAVLYEAFSLGEASPLPEPPIQYADFTLWQRDRLQDGIEPLLDWWRSHLEGAPRLLDLPADRPRGEHRLANGATSPFRLPAALSEKVYGLARSERTTLFVTLLAAYSALLRRYTGQEDFVVGTPVANRNPPETEELIGLFANTLALRIDLSGRPTFRELLARLAEGTAGAFAHGDLPFERLVEELEPERSLSHTPLFQVMLVLQNTPMPALELPALSMTAEEVDNGAAQLDLILDVKETPEGIAGRWRYDRDLFEAATLSRLQVHFETLLGAVVLDPAVELADLPLLSEPEQWQLLGEHQGAVLPLPDATLDELISAQAQRTPNATAVVSPDGSLTYGELLDRTRQLAEHLRHLGVGPETRVGIALDRSTDLIVSLLAVLEAGGAYVPLDPSYPADRLAWMLEDSGATILLAREAPVWSTGSIRILDPAGSLSRAERGGGLGRGLPDSLAYVIYTSGSTGRPKGAMNAHRGVVNRLLWMQEYLALTPADRVLQKTSASFDVSVWEFFWPLLTGARLVLARPGGHREPAYLARLIASEQITTAHFVPSLLREFLEIPDLDSCHSLHRVVCSGEAFPPDLARRFFERVPWAELHNLYGPTEAAVDVTAWRCDPNSLLGSLPIGRPVVNTQIHLLDADLQPVPLGVPGELFIGGVQVGRGYLGNPALTASAFIPDPFAHLTGAPGARLYRTGDKVRRLPDGALDFLGRLDHQVKVRGFRIELGEVEAALREYPGVRAAVAGLAQDGRLAAWFLPSAERSPAPAELRRFLAGRLPEPMVPSIWVQVESLLLTPSGKVDRRALARLEAASGPGTETSAAPRTPIEEVMAAIWSEVLGIESAGIEDDFFDLGGHSLLATRALARVREAFGVELPLRALFERPTIAGLAARVEEDLRGPVAAQAPPLFPQPRDGSPLPLSFAQERLWFFDRFDPESPAYNVPIAVRLAPATGLDVSALASALSEVVRRHEALRTAFPAVDGLPSLAIHVPAAVPLPEIDLAALPPALAGTEEARLAAAEARRPFDLARGPLFRAALVRLPEGEGRLLFTLHHIVSDARSLEVLFAETVEFYEAAVRRVSSSLPALAVQYADYSAWQRDWLRGPALDGQLAFWRERLAGAPPLLELPVDRPRPAVQGFRGALMGTGLPVDLSRRLRRLARELAVTPFLLLLAGFSALLHRLTGEDDVCVGSPVSNRSRVELEGLIGFFVNTLVLRSGPRGERSFTDLLGEVRETALAAFAHADLPFEKLVESLAPERSAGHTPLFQVMFALEGPTAAPVEVAGLVWRPEGADRGISQFDLSLSMGEEKDGGLRAVFEYSTDLFDAATIVRFLGYLENLLAGIAAGPDQTIAGLPLLAPSERAQLLVEWNDTAAVFPEDASIHELFLRQAERTPDAVALEVAGDGEERPALRMTYEELARRAEAVAGRLSRLGVGPESVVGLLLERSAEMAVGVLGTLFASGAYLPLDPAYPAERIDYMLEDSGARVLLTHRGLADRLPAKEGIEVANLDSLLGAISALGNGFGEGSLPPGREDGRERGEDRRGVGAARENGPSLSLGPSPLLSSPHGQPPPSRGGGTLRFTGVDVSELHPAYVIYTSGSTGQPKGVVVPHRALVHHATAWARLCGMNATDRVLQFASLSFDAAAEELFPTWLSGGSVVIWPEAAEAGAPGLRRLIESERLTVLDLPAAFWHEWTADLERAPAPVPETLRLVISGAEPASAARLEVWRSLTGGRIDWINSYGPTETTITATTYTPPIDTASPSGSVPIGRPLSNLSAYVVDRNGTLVPIGVPGELWIGGAGVTRGYLGRPDLTAERFAPDPFAVEAGRPGARLYRTGDLVRRLRGGEIEFLGRVDLQVKIRGFRIEPGEVEAALAAHPDIEAAAVLARPVGDGMERRLVAYVVPARDGVSVPEVRSWLGGRVPAHLVPSAFVPLEALPVTPNGKVDRRALARIAPEAERSERGFTAPRTRGEQALVEIWAEVLGEERTGGRIGVHDDFFELGGHSLLATQVVSRLRERLNVDLPLRRLFETPTVAGLAAALAEPAPGEALAVPHLPLEGTALLVYERVAAQAAHAQEAAALAAGPRRLTYGELMDRARLLARHLRSLGVGPDVPVGVHLERSPETAVAVLGIWLAGGAYVPLDPSHPAERLAGHIAETRMPALVTRRGLADRVRIEGIAVVVLEDLEELVLPSASDPLPAALPESRAYILYTSGSTGRPKGVEVSHAALRNLIDWHLRAYGVTAADRASLVAAPGFDASVWELWPYLTAGASVHVPDEETRLSPDRLLGWMTAAGITLAFLPTPIAEAVLELRPSAGLALRTLLTGGDRLRRVPRPGLPFALVNHYGPTESTVVATAGIVGPGVEGPPPIGVPIDGVRVRVLEDGEEVPEGELAIGGAGLARGYFGRPDLTAAAFVPDPFAAEPGARLYLTGDRVRRQADGALGFVGRIDRQVKVRGVRMELGEIEAALHAHPEIATAVALVAEDGRLAAFVVPREPQTEKGRTVRIRAFLRDRLPEPMIPSVFVALSSLPLTANGKLDRDALAALLPDVEILGEAAVLPRTALEERLAAIWCEVLGRERVGVLDDFFEIGGHSLLATRVAARVRQTLGVHLPLKEIFATPTVAALAAVVEAALSSPQVEDSALPVFLGEREAPLSFAQQRLWLLDRLEPGSPLYNINTALRIEGAVDEAALERALAEVVRRHEVLRTVFAEVVRRHEVLRTVFAESADGPAVQIVLAIADTRLPSVDLAGLPAELGIEEARRLAAAEAERPFDLSRGPMLRTALLRLGEAERLLLLTVHHIAADGWSVGVLVREMAALYQALRSGLPSPLAPLPLQYVDFSRWQRSWLEGEVLRTQLGYWREKLAGATPVLDLPSDRPRPTVRSPRGAVRKLLLPASLAHRLTALARREGGTLFMALLAAFGAMLRRTTGQDDLPVGSPIANRTRLETEDLIGFFVNTLVLRVDAAGDPGFRELLRRVRETTLEAYAHQDLPFERLVEELNPERRLAHTPLFQVMLVLQNAPLPSLELPGLRLVPVEVDAPTAKFDLTFLLASEGDGSLGGNVEYSTDLFEAATVDRLIGYFERCLAGVAAEPDARVSALPMLSAEERGQLLWEWNDSERIVPALPVHALFAAQAARTPEAPAVVFAGDARETFTYGELEHRAALLAGRLRHLGAGPGARVGLCVERSLDMAVGMLGILAAGSAYVPLDPSYPDERLAFMLEDSGAAALVTHRGLAEGLGLGEGRAILDLAAEGPSPPSPLPPALTPARERGAPSQESLSPDPDDLAYVIYTSGSTGRPKGVGLPHRALTNLVSWHRTVYADGLRMLGFASLSFDASAYEFLTCWASGGTLVLVPEEVRRDAVRLARLIEEEEVEAAVLPVVMLQQLAEEWNRRGEAPPRLRELIATGEQLQVTRPMVEVFQRSTGLHLHNFYGPTETHAVTLHTLEADPEAWLAHPSIGRPVANARIHLLDAGTAGGGDPVPAGAVGELYIGGDCLARGYLGRPDLTAERFVPNPFAALFGEPGGRLYRTGDRARHRPAGSIDYLGRADTQVKIRGFRVEPGEVEAALALHPALTEAAVIVRDGRLAAYVVARAGLEVPDAAELRDFLRLSLPDFMVPAVFLLLDALPLTPNRKVDRRALAEMAVVLPEMGTAPRTPAEEMLAGIWADILDADTVGPHEDFFALGGHSLLATQVLSRVRDVFGVEVPLKALFAAPTVAGLAAEIEGRRRGKAASSVLGSIPRRSTAEAPLSFAQQRLWLLDRLEPESPLYNIPAAVLLEGDLDTAALEATLDQVVRRHEALRTVFAEREGGAVQVVQPPSGLALPRVDLAGLPSFARDAETQRLMSEEALRPFDLIRGPLLRAAFVRLGGSEHLLLLTMHHIVSDGWSTGVLLREVGTLYEDFLSRRPPALEPLPVQYGDFAVWQRFWLAGPVLEAQLGYWRRRLEGAPAVLDLPVDRPRPAVRSPRGMSRGFTVPAEVAGNLQALSRERGATLFMTLLAAFGAFLTRWTGGEDLPIGTPIASRNRSEIEDLIGFFVNTLVLRLDVRDDPRFTSLLRRVREETLGAHDHQDLPFERLVEELNPERSLAHTPLFQVSFILQNAPMPELELPGLRLRPLDLDTGTTKFDLTVAMSEGEEGTLAGSVQMRADLFERTTLDRLAGWLGRLLAGVASEPGSRVADLPLLDDAERAQLLAEWNDTAANLPIGSLHELVEAQVERTPAAPAVLFREAVFSYRELDERASRLAERLRQAGVGPESIVGLHTERSFEMVVGLLGILKAGGAWLPLDPSYPRERLAYMRGDSGARVLLRGSLESPAAPWPSPPGPLSHPHSPHPGEGEKDSLGRGRPSPGGQGVRVGEGTGVRVLRAEILAIEEEAPSRVGTSPAPTQIGPDSLACVIYTSGSTGLPKGVALTHRGLVNRLLWTQERYRLTAADTVLFKAPFGFDFSIWECFGPLIAGARLLVAEPGGHQDTAYLARTIAERGVTIAHFVPSMLAAFLREEGVERCVSLRQVFSGGEALGPELRDRFFARLPVPLDNQYGPTEISIDTTFQPCTPSQDPRSVPIGRPIDNSRVFLLGRGRPVPLGSPGELCVGGPGLARGYLGRPDLTAERFIPDPFGQGERLYRTGDLARWLVDGTLDFLGRADQQVKVRGVRIEPGEIEAWLTRHPAITEAAVAVSADGNRLIAGWVAKERAVPPADLRDFLRERLPDSMVPGVFLRLAALPRTPSGKLDRRALAALAADAATAGPSAKTGEDGPRNPAEELLAGIWSEVLGRERLGVHNDFFELGGHSLLATQVISRVRRAFGVDLPLRALFASPTVAGLAGEIAALRRDEAVRQPPLLGGTARDGEPVPLSFAQQRLWLLDRLEPASPLYNIPAAVRIEGDLHAAALERALNEVIRRHAVLRTAFAERDGRAVQIVMPAPSLTLGITDLSGLPDSARETELRRLTREEASRPFDLGAIPLVRARLLRLVEREHALLFTLHHIASDGWSSGLLLREAAEIYHAALTGRPAVLPDLPVQYADFASWQREWLRGEVLDRQIDFWRRRLAGAPPVLELPLDRPRPAMRSGCGASHLFTLPAGLGPRLEALGRKEGATLFMTLLAGFAALLGRYTGEEDVPVGTAVSGRNRVEIERLIGFFVNTLVLRTDLSGEPTFLELLARVRESTLAAHAHQELPFERLVEELNPERSLAYTPLFQVMLVLQNTPLPSVELPELRLLPMEGAVVTAKFDLTLSITPSPSDLHGFFEYSTDLFEAATVDRLGSHLGRLLEGISSDPGRRLLDLPLLAAAERDQILTQWSQTAPAFSHTSILDLFTDQAVRTPDARAVVGEDESLTYAELDRRTDLLAGHLTLLGAGHETVVALCVERSPDLIVGILGILKSGAAYLPLDPSYPQERLVLMLEDTGARLLVTHRGLQHRLPPSLTVLDVVSLSREAGEGRGGGSLEPPQKTPPHPSPALTRGRGRRHPLEKAGGRDDLAYVLYTSGSTGRPKGVLVPHGGLSNLAAFHAGLLRATPGDRVLQLASYSFDASLLEILTALLSGAELHVASADRLLPGAGGLGDLLRERRITHLVITPPALAALPAGTELDLPDLRAIEIGAESCPPDLARRWSPGRLFINAYGPTEATVCCIVGAVESVPTGRVPIGRPIAGARALVLDFGLQPSPTGVPGELYLGGACLTRGYLGRPDLTAERFLPDPFGPPGERLYRTGDHARWLAAGELDILGRADRQVKLRGIRVEPGEVEAVLTSHPQVKEAAVVVREVRRGDLRLVAYLTTDPSTGAPSDLRAYLRERLPEPMVPSALVMLPELPLRPTGKVDRRALATDDRFVPEIEASGAASAPPRSPIEELLAGLWAEVLGDSRAQTRIGIHDGFFDLGGHSLLATQLVSRVRTAFGVDLPLRALFEEPTIAGFAARIERARAGEAGIEAPPLVSVPHTDEAPLSFAQERLWFLDRLQPGSAFYNIPMAFALDGELVPPLLAAVLGDVVRRHEALRTVFEDRAGGAVQIILPAEDWALPLVDLSALPALPGEDEARRLASEEADRPFDLERGPLLRNALLRLGRTRHVLLLDIHHIVADGWSMGVLVSEVSALYGAARSGLTSPLPDLPVQYADFAVWQRGWLSGEVYRRQMAYWRGRLEDAPALDLPTDRPRPAIQSFRGGNLEAAIEPPLAAGLLRLGRREGATPFMVLLAGFAAFLQRLTGQSDLVLGTPIANRNRTEIESLIGFFVNSLVLRIDAGGDPTVPELLARVRQTALDAYTHQDLPFERLVEELRPERQLSHNPLFQVMFALQNVPLGTVELPGLTLSPFRFEVPTVKLDLGLAFGEVETPEGPAFAVGLSYASDLFDAPTVLRWVGHLRTVLASIGEDSGRPLSDLPLLGAAEIHQLLAEWNDRAGETPGGLCLHELFAERAQIQPDAPAVISDGSDLSYGELAARADRLARHLAGLGVGPESRVAICMGSRPERVVAVLGVLAAGGAYVPVDPTYPDERLGFVLADSGARVLLTERRLEGRFEDLPIKVICLDDGGVGDAPPAVHTERILPGDWGVSTEASSSDQSLPSHIDGSVETPQSVSNTRSAFSTGGASLRAIPVQPAYIIYTSGSTGRPNGVVMTHAGAVHIVRHAIALQGLGPGRRVGQITSFGFDPSVLEHFAALASGAALCLVPEEERLEPEALATRLARERVSLIVSTPALVEMLPEERLPDLTNLYVGGEACPVELVDRWAPGRQLVNGYGPTETAVYTTYEICRPGESAGPPIGRPVPGSQAYVVDLGLQPLPAGAHGELLIGGAGLARGYLGRPDRTAERFVPDPFGSEPGARLYRTGDRVRRLPDGRLDFLGRLDHQIKLRGVRIELGEIESTLARHPEVREAVVLMNEEAGDHRLVAFVVRRDPDEEGVIEETEQVAAWQSLYDEAYEQNLAVEDQTFNFRGWNSSYTGEPIPFEEMREWIEAAAARILKLQPERVLEVGCGHGLLLYRVAPSVERYAGTDFSQTALDAVRRQLARSPIPSAEISLDRRLADDWSGVRPGEFDLVVINSVVQYFPDAAYLARVVEGAIRAVGPGGRIFLGDVRSLPLLEEFAESVELHHAPGLSAAELRRRVRRRIEDEEELVVDPAFFSVLARRLPAVRKVEVLPKEGRAQNELTRFRYDVVLHVEAAGTLTPRPPLPPALPPPGRGEKSSLGWGRPSPGRT